MSHAEVLHTFADPGATDEIVGFVSALRYAALSDEVRHYARRHLLDTVGVMIAGAEGDVATRAEAVLTAVGRSGRVPVPGRARRADLLDAAYLGGTAAHGIELDDGYRHGSAHCGCVVVPTVLALGHQRSASGAAVIEAMVAGYETAITLARACHPDLRQRGFHPTGAVGPFGAAMAAAKLTGLAADRLGDALGIAASSAAGLFAFVNGGADIKRLHAGHAAREGLQAALLAGAGRRGPARRGRVARRVHAGVRARPHRARARDRAAAGGAVRHHRLLHQALRVLPPHPAGGRGDHRADGGREDRGRRRRARRGRDLPHRRRARAYRLGRLRERAAELPLPDGGRAPARGDRARAFF